jgi:hypothetical protein
MVEGFPMVDLACKSTGGEPTEGKLIVRVGSVLDTVE